MLAGLASANGLECFGADPFVSVTRIGNLDRLGRVQSPRRLQSSGAGILSKPLRGGQSLAIGSVTNNLTATNRESSSPLSQNDTELRKLMRAGLAGNAACLSDVAYTAEPRPESLLPT